MLWIAARLSGGPTSESRKKVVLAACECASLSLIFVPQGEHRPHVAIETAASWARGEDRGITLADVQPAADAVSDAVSDADAATAAATGSDVASAAAAFSAAYSASAASAAAYYPSAGIAANSASSAAYYAAAAAAYGESDAACDAADDAGEPSARHATLKRCADIVRQKYPTPPRWPR